ncbi:DUF6232 family protein [Streptomyces sp. NBC_01264]|uniref:DUF6232 family protein n=1 Tax=Streptomyces sp. NBC_01264 TaxID=2903804 RepID=UPI00225BBD4D|nr:DUF6232 family protein [Streptomyces sp. NBC_01264]MCX4783202.1 DUF6232 family protein [Streptomyces sp. NBC_01264]
MTAMGSTGPPTSPPPPTPPGAAPPPPPPPPPPSVPPSEPAPQPLEPSQRPEEWHKRRKLVLKVSGRMLWVGSMAVPLHNISWVDAFQLKPNWGKALGNALKWLFGAAVLLVAFGYAGGDPESLVESGGNAGPLVLLVVVVLVAVEALGTAKPVLAVETAGGSLVVLTLPNMEQLRRIAEHIVYAINHPDAEFATTVYQYNTTNNNGPVAILNGGRGNTGFNR